MNDVIQTLLMNDVIKTLLQQMGGANRIAVMTGAQVIYDNDTDSVTLYFKRQTGANKISHLKVAYNSGSDLYDLTGYRYNRRSLQCPQVWSQGGVYADSLKRTCESVTGLYFSF